MSDKQENKPKLKISKPPEDITQVLEAMPTGKLMNLVAMSSRMIQERQLSSVINLIASVHKLAPEKTVALPRKEHSYFVISFWDLLVAESQKMMSCFQGMAGEGVTLSISVNNSSGKLCGNIQIFYDHPVLECLNVMEKDDNLDLGDLLEFIESKKDEGNTQPPE